jgi:hypothetical protein
MIFVFGSNEAGIHGGGAARAAREKHGAIWGQGVGPQGDSFAIPTKGQTMDFGKPGIGDALAIDKIETYVNEFLDYARQHPELAFQVTRIGCGFAGFTDDQIAPLFVNAPDNCLFDTVWTSYLPATARFWGTF